MPTLTTKEISSLRDYTEYIEQSSRAQWYRGCGDDCFELKPSLYRHPEISDAAHLFKSETDILNRFKQRSSLYLSTPINENDLSTLFIMQHFGVPTRLLDWTENPYIALFFALTDTKYDCSAGSLVYKSNAVVWVLDPNAWNNKALDFDPPPGIIYSLQSEEYLNGYMPGKIQKPDPIALFGVYNNARIAAQRGVFTLFGSNTKPMEHIYTEHSYPQDCLLKLVIKKETIGSLLQSLLRIGVTDSAVYPDLEGLAKELKRSFGYRV